MTDTEFCFWLVPAEPLRETLQAVIRRLAAEFDAVAFQPHVTVFVGKSTDAAARRIVSEIANRFAPITLPFKRIAAYALFSQALVIELEGSETLRSMFTAIRTSSDRNSAYVLRPHLSLMYQSVTEQNRRDLYRVLDVPTGEYRFDALSVVEIEAPFIRVEQIRRWRTVAHSGFKG